MPLCKWCGPWEAILAEEGNPLLDPRNPCNLLKTDCEHPPDYEGPSKKEEC
mgnify:CR=1 FL=1